MKARLPVLALGAAFVATLFFSGAVDVKKPLDPPKLEKLKQGKAEYTGFNE